MLAKPEKACEYGEVSLQSLRIAGSGVGGLVYPSPNR